MKIKMTLRHFVASNRRNHGGGSMSVFMMGTTHIRPQQISDHIIFKPIQNNGRKCLSVNLCIKNVLNVLILPEMIFDII